MARENMDAPSKTRIETLSDLIFGLALSIGALTLMGQAPSNFQDLVVSIAYYGFSFLILISVWYGYTRNMSLLRSETGRLVSLNILLLFLVSIEPFLFNQMLRSSMVLVEDISILYAFDLGGLFAVEALLANSIAGDVSKSEQIRHNFRTRRNTLLLSMGLFFVSTIPVFWSWRIHISNSAGIPLRFMIWIIPLFAPIVRRYLKKRGQQLTQ